MSQEKGSEMTYEDVLKHGMPDVIIRESMVVITQPIGDWGERYFFLRQLEEQAVDIDVVSPTGDPALSGKIKISLIGEEVSLEKEGLEAVMDEAPMNWTRDLRDRLLIHREEESQKDISLPPHVDSILAVLERI